jgi:circadian clock protein KaiA
MGGHDKQENQKLFLPTLSSNQQEFWQQMKADYRQILLHYFSNDTIAKHQIDKFINTVFTTKTPVPKIIEIHMEIVDEFSKQLKIEGRSDGVVMDYRLTLIDVLAHLCEIYRCSLS